MEFDKQNKVIIASLNSVEARAFVKFLQSEIVRHLKDVADAEDLMVTVREKFNIQDEV